MAYVEIADVFVNGVNSGGVSSFCAVAVDGQGTCLGVLGGYLAKDLTADEISEKAVAIGGCLIAKIKPQHKRLFSPTAAGIDKNSMHLAESGIIASVSLEPRSVLAADISNYIVEAVVELGYGKHSLPLERLLFTQKNELEDGCVVGEMAQLPMITQFIKTNRAIKIIKEIAKGDRKKSDMKLFFSELEGVSAHYRTSVLQFCSSIVSMHGERGAGRAA